MQVVSDPEHTTLTLLLTVLALLGGTLASFTSYEMMKGALVGVGLVVDKRLRPETMIELVRSIGGSEGLAGTLTAVAPGSL